MTIWEPHTEASWNELLSDWRKPWRRLGHWSGERFKEREVVEINVSLLSDQEKAVLEAESKNRGWRDELRTHRAALMFTGLWIVGCWAGFPWMVTHAPRSLSWLGPLFMLSTCWIPFRIMAKATPAEQLRANAYLESIGYRERVREDEQRRRARAEATAETDGPVYWVTGNYDPERYYGYSYSDRQMMRTFEVDGDTYDNWGESGMYADRD